MLNANTSHVFLSRAVLTMLLKLSICIWRLGCILASVSKYGADRKVRFVPFLKESGTESIAWINCPFSDIAATYAITLFSVMVVLFCTADVNDAVSVSLNFFTVCVYT